MRSACYFSFMSIMHAVDDRAETLTAASARRLRGKLAENRISGRQLGMSLGKSYTWMQRRMNGEVSMSAEDMEAIERATGISPLFLISGIETENRHPDGSPNGGSFPTVHPPGLEPGTH